MYTGREREIERERETYIHIYIYIYTHNRLARPVHLPVPVKKHSSKEVDAQDGKLSEHRIRGWRAVVAAGLHGQ